MRSLIDITDFSAEELDSLITLAEDIAADPASYTDICRGRKLATLFYEPSTRTRLSFEAAMLELGGSVIGFSEASSSSASKGESVADTARVLSCYADIIALRSPLEGAPLVASQHATVPVINAGDGGHSHPTQTLADLMTIRTEKGRLNNMTVGFCGDLKYGRTVHSLIEALSRYTGIRIVLISPDELRVPHYIRAGILDHNDIPYVETRSLENAIGDLDVLYMTRIQRERFDDKEQYERLKDSYILTVDRMKAARPDMIVMHPLPRVNEISVHVDDDPRACYFKQVLNGKYMRMALIIRLLNEAELDRTPHFARPASALLSPVDDTIRCANKKCITKTEQELEPLFYSTSDETCRCLYCDNLIRHDNSPLKYLTADRNMAMS